MIECDNWQDLKYGIEDGSVDFDDLDADEQYAMSFDSWEEYKTDRMADQADAERKRRKEHGP